MESNEANEWVDDGRLTMIWPDSAFTIILTILVLVISIFDLRQRRIPNFLVFPAMLVGLILHSIAGGFSGALFSLKGIGMGFGLLIIPYIAKGMKAGDVKFLMAIGAITGSMGVARILLVTVLCYPLLAAIAIIKEGKFRVTWLRFRRLLFNCLGFLLPSLKLYAIRLESQDDEKIASATTPFGVAIALGALISTYTGFLKALF